MTATVPPLAGALVLTILMFVFFIWLPVVILRVATVNVSFGDVGRIWFVSNLYKYLPGKIFMATVRIGMMRGLGVPPGNSAALFFVEMTLLSLASVILAAVLAPFLLAESHMWSLVIIVAGLVVLIQPPVLNRLVTTALRQRRLGSRDFSITYSSEIKGLALAVSAWLCYGVGAWLLANALTPVPYDKLTLFVAVAPLSWLAGMLAIVTPGGIGVREASMVIGLSQAVPEPIAISVAVLARLLWVIVEAAGAVWAMTVYGRTEVKRISESSSSKN
jgi:hypothetical protein